MKNELAKLAARWQLYSDREKRLVMLAFAVVVLALLVSLTESLLTERKRLDTRLAAGHQAVLQARSMASELASLAGRPKVVRVMPDEMLGKLATESEKRGLVLQVEKQGDNLRLEGVADLKTVLVWLASIQAETGWRPLSLLFDPASGGSRMEMILEAPKG